MLIKLLIANLTTSKGTSLFSFVFLQAYGIEGLVSQQTYRISHKPYDQYLFRTT